MNGFWWNYTDGWSVLSVTPLIVFRHDHRLNGSSSPVLTATSLSYGKANNSTPHRIKTPDLIEIKFGAVDYVGEITPHAKFHVNPSKGASRQMGEIYAKFFIAIYLFFRNSPTGQTLRRIFARDGKTTQSRARMCLLGVKKIEINI